MSQRLHVGKTDVQNYYDCVLESADGARDRLVNDWIRYQSGLYFGPWQVAIADISLFRKIEPVISDVLFSIGHQYPDDIQFFYYKGDTIAHPTKADLDTLLAR